MSLPEPKPKPRDQQPSAAARYLFLFLLGLAVGIFATVMVVRALQARADHFPSSVMHVQQWHMGQLLQRAEENRCNATDVLPHLRALRTMAEDLEPAFPRLRDNRRFAQHAAGMRAVLDDAPEPLTSAELAQRAGLHERWVREWAYKPVAFVSYGGVSAGTRGVQMTKQIATTLKLVPMFEAVAIPFFTEKIDAESGLFQPGAVQEKAVVVMLDEMLRWEGALRTLRPHER